MIRKQHQPLQQICGSLQHGDPTPEPDENGNDGGKHGRLDGEPNLGEAPILADKLQSDTNAG